MRLLSLHEPWATLMALKAKRIETRDWTTSYRGPLAIHASKHGMSLQDTLEQCLHPVFYDTLMKYEPFHQRMRHYIVDPRVEDVDKRAMKDVFPNRGKIVCVVNLKEIHPTTKLSHARDFHASPLNVLPDSEIAFGNYDDVDAVSGQPRQGWLTEHLFTLPEPIPFTSKQGLVYVPEVIQEQIREQWRGKPWERPQ